MFMCSEISLDAENVLQHKHAHRGVYTTHQSSCQCCYVPSQPFLILIGRHFHSLTSCTSTH